MKSLKFPVLVASLAALLGASSSWSAPQANPVNKLKVAVKQLKPDLVITTAHLQLAKECKRFRPVIMVTVRVKNIGKATSLAKFGVGMVSAKDLHGNGWGNGKGLPAIPPNRHASVSFPIFYLISNPGHMPGTHTFKFQVNSGKWIPESNYANNTKFAKITIPRGFCKPKLKLAPKKPDLIPILFKPMTGKVAVRNIGAGHAGKSLLLIKCIAAQPGGCAHNTAMNQYTSPAFPNYVVVKIPALPPGQVYAHYLKFWKTLKWRKGKYRFIAIADGSKIVAESNESNNQTASWLAK